MLLGFVAMFGVGGLFGLHGIGAGVGVATLAGVVAGLLGSAVVFVAFKVLKQAESTVHSNKGRSVLKRLSPILDILAPPETAEHGPGWGHFGPVGAGHYVKMVHNGVEYGIMQAYAEGFSLFNACEYELDNAQIAHLWMQGSVVRSWLCELAANAFEQEGNDLARLEPFVEDSGEGRWTVEDSIERRIPTPVITTLRFSATSVVPGPGAPPTSCLCPRASGCSRRLP